MGFEYRHASSLYQVLRSMEGQGLVTAAWEHLGKGVPRRVYQPTVEGERRLHAWLRTSTPEAARTVKRIRPRR